MIELTWHTDKAIEALHRWYKQAEDYYDLATKCRKVWMFSAARKCKQQALKCKTLGIVFHDRYKLVLENK